MKSSPRRAPSMSPRLFALLLAAGLLAACQGGGATTAPTSSPAATQVQGVQAGTQPAYPGPATPEPQAATAEGYPAATNVAGSVSWEAAEQMILTGRVIEITQLHSLEVRLVLNDGTVVTTTEPAIDDVLRIVEQCGEPCSDIVIATE